MPQLSDELTAAARRRSMADNPFIRNLRAGAYRRQDLAVYFLRLWHMADRAPRVLAACLASCPDRATRRFLTQNLLEEEGFLPRGAGFALADRRDLRHRGWVERLLDAVGCDRDAIERTAPRSDTRPSGFRWLDQRLAAGDWLGALAFTTLGFEANCPETYRLVAEPLRKSYGFAADELAFFDNHVTADELHGQDGLALLTRTITTPEDRARALAGARRGGDGWWWLHRASHELIRRGGVAAG